MTTDGNIHFPPGQRRDKPTFEPPPWERDQFEELARRKREAEPTPVETGEGTHKAETLNEASVVSEPVPVAGEHDETGVTVDEAEPQASSDKPPLDQKHVELLMMGLRSEEPSLEATYQKITAIAGAVSALIGIILATWGFVGLVSQKRAGVGVWIPMTMLLVFGMGFMVAGIWVVLRSLRQQGVL